jgi:hypothetical protein
VNDKWVHLRGVVGEGGMVDDKVTFSLISPEGGALLSLTTGQVC